MGKGACAQWLGAELPMEAETWGLGGSQTVSKAWV